MILFLFDFRADDMQIFKLLLVYRAWTFVRPVKARFAQGLDSVVCRRFAAAYRLTSIGSPQCRRLFLFDALDVQFIKLAVVNIRRTLVHRRHCQIVFREGDYFVD